MPVRSAPFVLAILLCAACEPSSRGPDAPPAVDATESRDAAPTQSTAAISKNVEVARAVWPAREAIDRAVLAKLSSAARAAVELAPVPALVPALSGLVEPAVVIAKPNFYAVSTRGMGDHAGLTVSVSSSRVSHRYEGVPAARPTDSVRGRPAWLTQNEGIWSASFEEHGVSYVVEVECDRPGDDPRCASDATLRAIAESLAFVGGAFEGGAR
jgi:hypothetical protein